MTMMQATTKSHAHGQNHRKLIDLVQDEPGPSQCTRLRHQLSRSLQHTDVPASRIALMVASDKPVFPAFRVIHPIGYGSKTNIDQNAIGPTCSPMNGTQSGANESTVAPPSCFAISHHRCFCSIAGLRSSCPSWLPHLSCCEIFSPG